MNTRRPILVHIPHSSLVIPEDIRADILLSDSELEEELLRITDWYVDELFADDACEMMLNNFSRLVFDPERFRDDDMESMARIGLGAVYTHTCGGKKLRNLDQRQREEMLARYYDPYHRIFELKVRELLKWNGRCLIVDAHSFPLKPLPYEDPSLSRPDVCIGTDDHHTPDRTAKFAWDYFLANGFTVAYNSPFSGTIVPIKYYQNDRRVASIMIEVRRSLYIDEATGEKSGGFERVKDLILGFLRELRLHF